jgi:hypothetical protein
VHGKKWNETKLQCIMYTVFATYLSADPRTTLKTLNCLTSRTKDEPNLGKPNEMFSFRSMESTTSTFADRYTNRKAAAALLYSCQKPGTITSVTTRMVPFTYRAESWELTVKAWGKHYRELEHIYHSPWMDSANVCQIINIFTILNVGFGFLKILV